MFYVDLYIINVYVILPPDLGPFAVNKYIQVLVVIGLGSLVVSVLDIGPEVFGFKPG
jgi:hypothetical protein